MSCMTPLTERTGGSREESSWQERRTPVVTANIQTVSWGNSSTEKTGCKNTPQPKRQRCEMFALLCRSAHHTPWIEPRTMRDLWLNPGPGPQLCSCFRLDRATLCSEQGDSSGEVTFGFKSSDRDKNMESVCVCLPAGGHALM